MKNNWQEVKLDNVCELIAGFAFKSKDFGAYPDKVVKITNIEPPFVNMTNLVGVDLSKYNRNNLAKFIVKRGDYVLAMTGATIGKLGRISNDDIAYINQRVLKFKPNDGVDKDFLFFILSESNFSQYILNHIDSESAQANISAKTIGQYEFELPPLDAQKRISAVLGSLDNKIELNNKINQNLDWEDYFSICRKIIKLEKENQNLEAQAQAIFKSWFVDFEPFGGKMPADWKSGTFSELIANTVGGDWGKDELQDNYTEEVYCIRGADIPDVKIGNRGKMPKRYILQKNYSLKKLNDGDLVVEISGGSPTQSTGRIAAISDYLLNRYKNKIICTNFCKSLKPKKNYSEYVYHYWQYLYDKNIFFGYENGTTGIKNLDISAFLETEPVIIPSQNILVAFAEVCKKTFAQIYHNGYENETLAQLRDTLLPKLMSGEIDVSDVAV